MQRQLGSILLEWGQGTCKKSRPCPARAYTTLVVLVIHCISDANGDKIKKITIYIYTWIQTDLLLYKDTDRYFIQRYKRIFFTEMHTDLSL